MCHGTLHPWNVSPFLRLTAVSAWMTPLNTSVFRLPCSLLSSFPIPWQRREGGLVYVTWEAWGGSRLSGHGFAGPALQLAILLQASANVCCKSTSYLFQLSLGLAALASPWHLRTGDSSETLEYRLLGPYSEHSLSSCLALTLAGSMAGLLALSLAFSLQWKPKNLRRTNLVFSLPSRPTLSS